ncbi:hypothetical protein GNP80_03670 [Aliivibrio fischeri]|nr:hypothetical protein [Aliivibrio fischeri]MUK91549.1 hypothetical protein [Aliivibrio fischeri]
METLIKHKYLFGAVLVMGFLFGFGSTVGQILGQLVGFFLRSALFAG